MSVRWNYAIDDIQSCVYSLLKKLATYDAPWTSWYVVRGWPEADVFNNLENPFIFVEEPTFVDSRHLQGAGKPYRIFEMRIGLWDDRKTGGPEEINIMSSHLLGLFIDPNNCHTETFDVTLDVAYETTTLLNQGIKIKEIRGPRDIMTEDLKEFRKEFTLTLTA
jgi:hypothetical protein